MICMRTAIIDWLSEGAVLLAVCQVVHYKTVPMAEQHSTEPGPAVLLNAQLWLQTHARREERQLGGLEQIKGDTYYPLP